MSTGIYQPEPRLDSFADLVRMATSGHERYRLLVVLVRVDAVFHRGANGGAVRAEGEGGLTPVMVKDFALNARTRIEDIVGEADQATREWEFLMTAVLPGRDRQPPAPAESEAQLKRMAQTLLTGGDLSRFAFFDRDGDPLVVHSAEGA